MKNIIIIDNFDSFTYNLVTAFERLGASVSVIRTDESLALVEAEVAKNKTAQTVGGENRTRIVLSPGPGHPDEVALFKQVLGRFKGRSPILGVCLGHQAIGSFFGAKVDRAPAMMHGKLSYIIHNRTGIFKNVPVQLQVCRYHSLAIQPDSIPQDKVLITAQCSDGVIMGIQSKEYPSVVGLQFHPESYFTEYGHQLLDNFLNVK